METQGSQKASPAAAVAAPRPQAHAKPASGSSPWDWVPSLAYAFVAFICVSSIYRARNDPEAETFLVVSFLDLLLFFRCLRLLEATPRDSPRRTPLKVAVWLLSTLLTTLFAGRIAALMPTTLVKAIVWGMTACSAGAGFAVLLVLRERAVPASEAAADGEKQPLKRVEGI